MLGRAAVALSAVSVGVYGAWQYGKSEKPVARFLADNFTLGEATTMQARKLQTVVLYPLCHSSLLHLASNVSVYLTIGSALEALEGASILLKLGLVCAPLGFVLAHSLKNSSQLQNTPLQSTRGGGCLSAAFATYYLATYPGHEITFWGRRVKGASIAMVLLALECCVSFWWAGSSSLDTELGGAAGAAYLVVAKRILRK